MAEPDHSVTRHETPVPPTRHEPAGPVPTRHEKPINYVKAGRRRGPTTRLEAGAGTTRHENLPGSPSPVSTAASTLPPELFPLLTDVRGLPRSGQSESLRATHVGTGDDVFVKLYYEHSPPEVALLDMLRDADGRRVAQVLQHGVFHDPFNGAQRWWELQRYHPLGTLTDRMVVPERVREQVAFDVLAELTEALCYCHTELDHAHRDLKPANVLVRHDAPLELVLADFGSARQQTISRHFSQSVRMTEPYAAPESLNGHLGKEQDWWALGMIVLEILLGAHPYAGLESRTVRDRLTNYDVDLDGVRDERWRRLLGGLLTREREHRWGAAEVGRWTRGESPDVVRGTAGRSGPGVPPVDVDGRALHTPAELAALFVDEPAHAQDWLRREHERLADWLASDIGDTSWSVQPLRRPITTDADARRQMASYVAHFAPHITPPSFRGHHVDVQGLTALAGTAAAAGPDSDAGEIVAEIINSRLLGVFARHGCTHGHTAECGPQSCGRLTDLARNPNVPTIHDNAEALLTPYVAARGKAGIGLAGAPDRDEVVARAEALVLAYLLDPEQAQRDADDLRRRKAPDVMWWSPLRDGALRSTGPLSGLIALALATLTRGQAEQQHRVDSERARLAAKERDQRNREARRAERDRELEARRSRRHAQTLRTNRVLTRWSVPVLAGGVFLGLLEVLRLIDPTVHAELYTTALQDPTFFLTKFYSYWYTEANQWLGEPPFVDLAGPLVARSTTGAHQTVLVLGAVALLALVMSGRLRRSPSTLAQGVFVAIVLCTAAVVFLLLPEVAAVVGAVTFGIAGIGIGIVVVGVVLVAMMAGS